MRVSSIGFIVKACPGLLPPLGASVRRCSLPRELRGGWVLWAVIFCCASSVLSAQTNDPWVAVQPVGGAAATGETFAFSTLGEGSTPLSYQWYFNGSAVASATNSALLLTNLSTGDAGSYSTVVTNSIGSVTSSVADLFVVTTAPRVVWAKDVVESGGNVARVPLVLSANGRESSICFSLHYDTNTFGAPTYEWEPGNRVRVISSNVVLGEIGFEISRAPAEMFAPGAQALGDVLFSLIGTNTTVLDGRLTLTNAPVTVQANDTNGFMMLLSAAVAPQVEVSPPQPELNLQSGLYEQEVSISNPSGTTFQNLPVYVPFLGVDPLTNTMRLFNAVGSAQVDLDGDGVLETAAFVTVTNLPPGTNQVFTNGFYVTHHGTSLVADYYLGVGGTPGIPMPATIVPLRITRLESAEVGFTLEWSTRPGRTYSVRYAGDLADLFDPGLATLSTNTLTGTGSPAQWVDDGPVEASRFYQVIESQ